MLFITWANDAASVSFSKEITSFLSTLRKEWKQYLTGKLTTKDTLLIVGDDNFILHTIHAHRSLCAPLLCFSPSSSFLSVADPSTFRDFLRAYFRGKYQITPRSRLQSRFGKEKTPPALNDIGIFSSQSATLISYTLEINGKDIWNDRSDGIVVSTPTGSTGYSVSAGGPIILHDPPVFSITSLSSLEKYSPLIVPQDAQIRIKNIVGPSPTLVVDGDYRFGFKGNEVSIGSYDPVSFLTFAQLTKRLFSQKSAQLYKIKTLPPSAKLLFSLLSQEKRLTQRDLVNQSLLPDRTVRHALQLLLKKGYVAKETSLEDARRAWYKVVVS